MCTAQCRKQLNWLEAQVAAASSSAGQPTTYLVDEQLTLADLTWFPTCVFMEFMLPRVFGWPQLFEPGEETPFPGLARWYTHCRTMAAFS